MDVRWLEDFLLLAASRSFARAAAARHVSQAAFGRRIKAIEAWVGVPLIDRSEFPVALTAQGVLFRDAAEAALRALTDVRELLRGQAAASLGVTLVTGRSLALNFLPPWFERLKSRVPDLRARVLTTAMPDGTLMLVEGGVDFLLSYWNEGIPLLLDGGEFEYLSVGRECLLPVSVPLAGGAPRHALPGLASRWRPAARRTSRSACTGAAATRTRRSRPSGVRCAPRRSERVSGGAFPRECCAALSGALRPTQRVL